jgi:antitoxin ParD1/3/4
MSISLTSDQENLIEAKLASGKYSSVQHLIGIALRLLDEYESADAAWVAEARMKVEAAIEASNHTTPIDGETFMNQVLERFQTSDRS